MPGAVAFAARAALRAGCGSLRIAAPEAVLRAALILEPSATGIGRIGRIRGGTARQAEPVGDAYVAGCGWAATGHVDDLRSLWAQAVPLVVDGGGLRALARGWPRLGPRAAPTVLTPHPGEHAGLARALGLAADPMRAAERRRAAGELATATGAIVVLKGRGTVISDGGRTAVDRTGGPVLAIPGSGDVLAGLIGSFLAQGMQPWSAVRLGVAVHAAAGERWRIAHGDRGLRAAELADLIPAAIRTLHPPARRRSPPDAGLR